MIGEPGVGTEEFARSLLRARQSLGARESVLEAAPFQLNAGMSHIAQLEGRVAALVKASRGGRLTVFMPSFGDAIVAGAWDRDPDGLVGKLIPHLAAGELRLVGETTLAGWAAITQRRPDIQEAVEVIKLAPLTRSEARAVAREWLDAEQLDETTGDVLDEALVLAAEQLGDALPGPLLRLLGAAATAAAEDGTPRGRALNHRHLLDAVRRITGLARVLVDPSVRFDLAEVRRRFSDAVIGQPEAVDAIVDRLTMAKAGLADPTRPLGVFLFVGPTGTGKTELAKQLAIFLSESADALVRFDMSEFQAPGSANRLLGGADDGPRSNSGLVAQIAARPASVVLLDEFEKAHPSVWDVFLQIFDDARATDRAGNVADFRHAVVILTSNLGSSTRVASPLGFRGVDEPERSAVEDPSVRAVMQTFRPEFVNRIDRIVSFRPLTKSVMRSIVRRELAAVERRRGLRTRPWAIEWDDSAVEALLREGFTADMGARPLKRAVERHVLVPLARSIATHAIPSGDQFLFVRGGAGTPIEVQFVDPDAPEDAGPPVRPRPETALSEPRAIARAPLGTVEEYMVLHDSLAFLRQRMKLPDLAARKDELLVEISSDGFWERDDRHLVLEEAERLDAQQAALSTLVGLAERLSHVAGRAGAAELTRLVALRLFVLEEDVLGVEEEEPRDATLVVRPTGQPEDSAWPDRIAAMYAKWAHARGIALEESSREDHARAFEVRGLGAYRLLRDETGLHIWSEPTGEGRKTFRSAALVVCAPHTPVAAEVSAPARPRVVRRYQRAPSPLVRDVRQGWRTGHLSRVLGGDFDLYREA